MFLFVWVISIVMISFFVIQKYCQEARERKLKVAGQGLMQKVADTIGGVPKPKLERPKLEKPKHELIVDDTQFDPALITGASGLGGGPDVAHELVESKASEVMTKATEEDVESIPRAVKPFVDWLWVEAKAGNGGDPLPGAMRRQIPVGPGWGGHGANIYMVGSHLTDSFLDIHQKVKARHGENAHGKSRGCHAKHHFIHVPVGTIVRERFWTGLKTCEGRKIHRSVFKHQFLGIYQEETIQIAQGGLGGVGPSSFKKNDGRAATPGVRKLLELELRVITDVALIGTVNSGKTSLLAAMSRAHTRIGPEAYSTTRPHVGVLGFRDGVEVRVCDLPGIEHGASEDKLKVNHCFNCSLNNLF